MKESDEATKAGKLAQLLSEERPDVFSITVYAGSNDLCFMV